MMAKKKEQTITEKIRELHEMAQFTPTILGGPAPDVESIVESSEKVKNEKVNFEEEAEPKGLNSYRGLRLGVLLLAALLFLMLAFPYISFIGAFLGHLLFR